ncbi:hypothetical protein MRX96_004097 [Rhipicephalus microplus]
MEAGATTRGPRPKIEWTDQQPRVAAEAAMCVELERGVSREEARIRPNRRRLGDRRPRQEEAGSMIESGARSSEADLNASGIGRLAGKSACLMVPPNKGDTLPD